MLVFNYHFFLLNVLIWSIFMLGIKIRTVLKSELNGLQENVQILTLVLGGQSIVSAPTVDRATYSEFVYSLGKQINKKG